VAGKAKAQGELGSDAATQSLPLPNRYVLSLAAVAPEAGDTASLFGDSRPDWTLRYQAAPEVDGATPIWAGSGRAEVAVLAHLRGMLLLPGTHIIGRSPDCSLQFPIRGVSRRHVALLVMQGRGLVVRDLGSTNGSILNGQRIREAAIDGPALLDVGPLRFALRPVVG